MQVEIEGKMVEVDNAVIMEGVKSIPEYNAELDRMRTKGEEAVRTTLTGEHQTALEALKAEQVTAKTAHERALEAAMQTGSGEKDEVIKELKAKRQEITTN